MKPTLLLFITLFISLLVGNAQVPKKSADSFVLRGIVVEAETNDPISRVNVEVNNGAYTTTNVNGEFSISAEIGDELSVKSDAFTPVFYTIKDEQNITIKVQRDDNAKATAVQTRLQVPIVDHFKRYIDSAKMT